jgi:hypothetical protein
MLIAFIVGAMSTADGRQGRRSWRGTRRRRHYARTSTRLAERCVAASRRPRLQDLVYLFLVSCASPGARGGKRTRRYNRWRHSMGRMSGDPLMRTRSHLPRSSRIASHRRRSRHGGVEPVWPTARSHRVLACSLAYTVELYAQFSHSLFGGHYGGRAYVSLPSQCVLRVAGPVKPDNAACDQLSDHRHARPFQE